MGSARILLVDDHRVVAEGLRALFDDYDDFEVVGIANSAAEAMEMAAAEQPDASGR
jgi:two-component system, NarL family, response regulator DevR